MQRPVDASLRRLERRDHGVEPRAIRLEPCVRGEELQVSPLAAAPPVLDRLDQHQRAPDVRPSARSQHRFRLRLSPAHCEIAVDAGVRLGRAPVELDEPIDRAVEVVRIEAVELLGPYRCFLQHLLGQTHEESPVTRLRERVRYRQVRDSRGEQHRPVRLLRPQVAEDVVGRLRVLEVAYEPFDALAPAAVDLPEVEGAVASEEDPSRSDAVRAEVDEGAHRALGADGLGDGRFVKAVLERDDEPLVGEPRSDRRKSRLRVVRLDGE